MHACSNNEFNVVIKRNEGHLVYATQLYNIVAPIIHTEDTDTMDICACMYMYSYIYTVKYLHDFHMLLYSINQW